MDQIDSFAVVSLCNCRIIPVLKFIHALLIISCYQLIFKGSFKVEVAISSAFAFKICFSSLKLDLFCFWLSESSKCKLC